MSVIGNQDHHSSSLSRDTKALMAFESNKKSAGAAYLLWIFLGGLGVHRFYLGHSGTGVTILLLTIVGVLTAPIGIGFLPLAIVGLWVLCDLFLVGGMVREYNNKLMMTLSAG